MKSTQLIAALTCLVGFGPGLAHAEFTGPAPLAWRWIQPAPVPPGPIAVANNVIYSAVGRRVYALDSATGNQKWRFPIAEPLPTTLRHGVALAKGLVIAAADDRNIYALESDTGRQKWSFTAPQSLLSPPEVTGEFLTLSLADNSILAINISDGTQAWTNSTRIFNGIKGQIGAAGTSVLVFDQTNKLYSIDTGSKRVNWELRFNELPPNVHPMVLDDTIFVTSGPYVVGVNPANGNRKGATINFGETLAFAPAVTTDHIAGITRDGRLLIADRSGGRRVTRVELNSAPVAAPSAVGQFVGVNLANGSMVVIDPKTGKTVWNYILRPAVKPKPDDEGKTPPNYMTAAMSPLLVGDSLLLISRDGSMLNFDKKNGVDMLAPEVSMIFPLPGSELNPRYAGATTNGTATISNEYVTLYWQVDDLASGMDFTNVKVTANGQPLVVQGIREGYVIANLGESKNRFATNGRVVFQVMATDWMGNVSNDKFVLTFDNTLPPTEKPGTASSESGTPGGSRRGISGGG